MRGEIAGKIEELEALIKKVDAKKPIPSASKEEVEDLRKQIVLREETISKLRKQI